jgi:hypothetical protein
MCFRSLVNCEPEEAQTLNIPGTATELLRGMRWELQNAAYQIQCERFGLSSVQTFTTQLPQLQTIHKLSQTEGVQSLPVVVSEVHRTISPPPDNRDS